ncbi:ABC transporter ATP-binding protein [Paeniglutamicibacter cryotolerans]|uniref:Putative ABC transport system ATP-binding protein n=1 Tax=Paeniglutamicibacter cryotolerans TaxID=670079 RepID=A0A839QNZ4_9MICC|nr:ABC transporter ATP-binding protein [Paeniglutamicibacter cryotolerans]MBB2997480.1 putative ABC transport system ATP-binding protein [Paeniglutamicibacter cryotolerans]
MTITREHTSTSAAVSAIGLTKVYGEGGTRVEALRGVDVAFARARFTAIMGPSGSGKSTLMHCLAGLDTATSGSISIGDRDISTLNDDQLTRLRRDSIGFVFQAFNLVPTLSAKANILLPLQLAGRKHDPAWMATVVSTLGLGDRLTHKPHELSGGQQQRVAVARALLTRPEVVFGDEPTGNLDSRSGAEVLSLLRSSTREMGQTIIMVTHDPVAASYADQVLLMKDGQIVGTLDNPTVESVTAALSGLGA